MYLQSLIDLAEFNGDQDEKLNLACCMFAESFGKQGKEVEAFRYYMRNYVFNSILGTRNEKPIPDWVREDLFKMIDVPARPTNLEEWVAAFPGSAVIALNDRKEQPVIKLGRQVYEPGQARDRCYGQFLTVNPVKGVDHKDEDVTGLKFFFLDFDGGDKIGLLEKINGLKFKPSILVETRNGFHVYYRLKPHNRGESDWRAVEREMIEREGADRSASNPARVFRMPFTWHCKGEPFLVELRDWNENRYTFEAIEAEYAPKPKKQYNGKNIPVRLKRAPNKVLLKGDRHAGLLDYLKAAYFIIRDNPEYASAVRAYTKEWYPAQQSPLQPDWEFEVDKACDWFESRQWGGVASG